MGRKKHISLHPTPLQTGFPEPYGMQFSQGLRAEYWCSQIATQGCDDPRVMLWLQAEYAAFRAGDTPSQVGAGWVLPSLLLLSLLLAQHMVSLVSEAAMANHLKGEPEFIGLVPLPVLPLAKGTP